MKLGDTMKKKKRKLKKKVKIVLTFLVCIIIITTTIIVSTKNGNKTSEKTLTQEEKIIKELKKIPYYKEENKDRYISYQKENKNLDREEIVTNVNIGIDKP